MGGGGGGDGGGGSCMPQSGGVSCDSHDIDTGACRPTAADDVSTSIPTATPDEADMAPVASSSAQPAAGKDMYVCSTQQYDTSTVDTHNAPHQHNNNDDATAVSVPTGAAGAAVHQPCCEADSSVEHDTVIPTMPCVRDDLASCSGQPTDTTGTTQSPGTDTVGDTGVSVTGTDDSAPPPPLDYSDESVGLSGTNATGNSNDDDNTGSVKTGNTTGNTTRAISSGSGDASHMSEGAVDGNAHRQHHGDDGDDDRSDHTPGQMMKQDKPLLDHLPDLAGLELDTSFDNSGAWQERAEVITKDDHQSNVQVATGIIDDILERLPLQQQQQPDIQQKKHNTEQQQELERQAVPLQPPSTAVAATSSSGDVDDLEALLCGLSLGSPVKHPPPEQQPPPRYAQPVQPPTEQPAQQPADAAESAGEDSAQDICTTSATLPCASDVDGASNASEEPTHVNEEHETAVVQSTPSKESPEHTALPEKQQPQVKEENESPAVNKTSASEQSVTPTVEVSDVEIAGASNGSSDDSGVAPDTAEKQNSTFDVDGGNVAEPAVESLDNITKQEEAIESNKANHNSGGTVEDTVEAVPLAQQGAPSPASSRTLEQPAEPESPAPLPRGAYTIDWDNIDEFSNPFAPSSKPKVASSGNEILPSSQKSAPTTHVDTKKEPVTEHDQPIDTAESNQSKTTDHTASGATVEASPMGPTSGEVTSQESTPSKGDSFASANTSLVEEEFYDAAATSSPRKPSPIESEITTTPTPQTTSEASEVENTPEAVTPVAATSLTEQSADNACAEDTASSDQQQTPTADAESPAPDAESPAPVPRGAYTIDWDSIDEFSDPFGSSNKLKQPNAAVENVKKLTANESAKEPAANDQKNTNTTEVVEQRKEDVEKLSSESGALNNVKTSNNEQKEEAAVVEFVDSKTSMSVQDSKADDCGVSESVAVHMDNTAVSEAVVNSEDTVMTNVDVDKPESPVPIPKGAYTIDWDNLDENTNPFASSGAKMGGGLAHSPPIRTGGGLAHSPPIKSSSAQRKPAAVESDSVPDDDSKSQQPSNEPPVANEDNKDKSSSSEPSKKVIRKPKAGAKVIPKRNRFRPPPKVKQTDDSDGIQIFMPGDKSSEQSTTTTSSSSISTNNIQDEEPAATDQYKPIHDSKKSPPPDNNNTIHTSSSSSHNDEADHSAGERDSSGQFVVPARPKAASAAPNTSDAPHMDATSTCGAGADAAGTVDLSSPFIAPEDEQFAAVTDPAIFDDPSAWDMLDRSGTGVESQASKLARQSLYVKFDPLVGKVGSPVPPKNHQVPSVNNKPLADVKESDGDTDVFNVNTPPASTHGESSLLSTTSTDEHLHNEHQRNCNAAATPASAMTSNAATRANANVAATLPATAPGVKHKVIDLLSGSPKPAHDSVDVSPVDPLSATPAMRLPSQSEDVVSVLKFSQQDVTRMMKEWELNMQSQLLKKDKEHDETIRKLRKEHEEKSRELTKENKSLTGKVEHMKRVMEQFEATMMQVMADNEAGKDNKDSLVKERDQLAEDLQSVEAAFSDLHRRFEKSKKSVDSYKKNEDILKKCVTDYQQKLHKQEQKYEILKQQAEQKLEKANEEIEKLKATTEQEQRRAQAATKRAELQIQTLEQTIEQKEQQNRELTAICDELLGKTP